MARRINGGLRIEDLVKGEIAENERGTFLLCRRRFEDFDIGTGVEYVHRHWKNIWTRNLEARLPEFGILTDEKVLIFDIETAGFLPDNPLICISTASLQRDRKVEVECAFARDFIEEAAVLHDFIGKARKADIILTYNGTSFDIPRLIARQIAKGMYSSQDNVLNKMREEDGIHRDIYLIGTSKGLFYRVDNSLQHLERKLFHFVREGDIPGEKIEPVYFEYVYGRKAETREIKVHLQANQELWEACWRRTEDYFRRNYGEDFRSRITRPIFTERVLRGYNRAGGKADYEWADGLWKECLAEVKKEHPQSREKWQDYAVELFERRGGKILRKLVPGRRINPDDCVRQAARIVEHGMLDVASPVGFLAYLCSPYKSAKPHDLGNGFDNHEKETEDERDEKSYKRIEVAAANGNGKPDEVPF